MSSLEKLLTLREKCVPAQAVGLSDEILSKFLPSDASLQSAIESALKRMQKLPTDFPDLLKLTESDLSEKLQAGYLNFYPPESSSPYVPLAAKGPWIITIGGGVIYDTGGYGMLGSGHDPDDIREAMSQPYVMANVMTPSFSQRRLMTRLREKIGFSRDDKQCPFARFVCMNSGSEAMAVATRISDAHAKVMTDPGAKHEGKEIKAISLRGSFHGRTTRPARVSHSSRKKYQTLATFRDLDNLLVVEPNNEQDLRDAFQMADDEGLYIEAVYMEPVMGEGNPGQAVTPQFYDVARQLTLEHDSFLIIDSIQASLRAQGVISVVDYPGFASCQAPDMEAYSKALNAGQYPFSLLALSQDAFNAYQVGTYGNTMTTNPRALEVACAVLDAFPPELTQNIRERGKEFVQKLEQLQQEMPQRITKVQGTGLLVSAELIPEIPVTGFDGVEQEMRHHGVQVIHGGKNCLRYTPRFGIDSKELDLLIQVSKEAIETVATRVGK